MLLQNSRTRISQLMNTSGFHQNVGEWNKSFNAMSPDPLRGHVQTIFGKINVIVTLRAGPPPLLTSWILLAIIFFH